MCVLRGQQCVASPSQHYPNLSTDHNRQSPQPAEKCGDEFAAHLCGRVLPSLGLPAEVQQQLVYHVRESDSKQLKDCLRIVLLQANAGGGGGGGGGAGGAGAGGAPAGR
jgi:hypothetical protein